MSLRIAWWCSLHDVLAILPKGNGKSCQLKEQFIEYELTELGPFAAHLQNWTKLCSTLDIFGLNFRHKAFLLSIIFLQSLLADAVNNPFRLSCAGRQCEIRVIKPSGWITWNIQGDCCCNQRFEKHNSLLWDFCQLFSSQVCVSVVLISCHCLMVMWRL